VFRNTGTWYMAFTNSSVSSQLRHLVLGPQRQASERTFILILFCLSGSIGILNSGTGTGKCSTSSAMSFLLLVIFQVDFFFFDLGCDPPT
jgi:hypothetical protein